MACAARTQKAAPIWIASQTTAPPFNVTVTASCTPPHFAAWNTRRKPLLTSREITSAPASPTHWKLPRSDALLVAASEPTETWSRAYASHAVVDIRLSATPAKSHFQDS